MGIDPPGRRSGSRLDAFPGSWSIARHGGAIGGSAGSLGCSPWSSARSGYTRAGSFRVRASTARIECAVRFRVSIPWPKSSFDSSVQFLSSDRIRGRGAGGPAMRKSANKGEKKGTVHSTVHDIHVLIACVDFLV